MLEVVKLFEESSTVDELGIGRVRDTFSNALFPGTSTLHTRVKYVLFVAWLVNDVARHRWPVKRSLQELRQREVKLIGALLQGEESEGVIGRDAKSTLKRMPSAMYWASLQQIGVRRWKTSLAGYFRNATQRSARADDPDGHGLGADPLGMVTLPPPPEQLLENTTFALNRDEAEFLRARVTEATRGSLLAWLALNHPESEASWVWEHEARDEFPPAMSALVDEARRLHLTATAPALLYNLMLAEETGNEEVREEYADHLRESAERLVAEEVFNGWDRAQFWNHLFRLNPGIRPSTKRFLDDWWTLAEAGQYDSKEARDLVTQRELQLKRGRARLTYPDARSTWGIGAGTGLLDYRWDIAKSHLNDVAEGLGA